MKRIIPLFFIIFAIVAVSDYALSAKKKPKKKETVVTYFSCNVNEKDEGDEVVEVNIKFAVANLDTFKGTGSLVEYPVENRNEETPLVLIAPEMLSDETYSLMSNLNAQGGDLRIRDNGDIVLFGDGDGYQFTDLVIWDGSDIESDDGKIIVEGYVRDYGSAYGDAETFKQFIKCQRAMTPL